MKKLLAILLVLCSVTAANAQTRTLDGLFIGSTHNQVASTFPVANVAALRALTTTVLPVASLITVASYFAAANAAPDGLGFVVAYVPGDTTSTDNGVTIFVDASGRRWYRLIMGALGTVSVQSGSTYTFSSTDCGTEIVFTNASAIVTTIPRTLPAGCNFAVLQAGGGQVSVNGSAVTPATLQSAHSYTGTFGQWAIIGINIESNSNGSSAVAVLTGDGFNGTPPTTCTGGTHTASGSNTIITFTASGTLNCNGSFPAQVLVQGGGGAGSGSGGGGGGAGGYCTTVGTPTCGLGSSFTIASGSMSVTVGAGGVAASGANSVLSTITATGGGLGGAANSAGTNGGSGGGGGADGSGATHAGGTGSQGNNGGSNGGINGGQIPAGGGGGAGAAGGVPVFGGAVGGAGGNGVANSISGSSVTYGGGGGGSTNSTGGTGGTAGTGGGGAGGSGVAGSNATANTGGGGGGGGSGQTGGNGGSGIVIISCATAVCGT